VQSHIFDPFFTTKDVGEGTGLGLDVVRRIVTARCEGEIDFRTRPGETVFQVRLPVARACDS
jgi:signal transduction histidine kinase